MSELQTTDTLSPEKSQQLNALKAKAERLTCKKIVIYCDKSPLLSVRYGRQIKKAGGTYDDIRTAARSRTVQLPLEASLLIDKVAKVFGARGVDGKIVLQAVGSTIDEKPVVFTSASPVQRVLHTSLTVSGKFLQLLIQDYMSQELAASIFTAQEVVTAGVLSDGLLDLDESFAVHTEPGIVYKTVLTVYSARNPKTSYNSESMLEMLSRDKKLGNALFSSSDPEEIILTPDLPDLDKLQALHE